MQVVSEDNKKFTVTTNYNDLSFDDDYIGNWYFIHLIIDAATAGYAAHKAFLVSIQDACSPSVDFIQNIIPSEPVST